MIPVRMIKTQRKLKSSLHNLIKSAADLKRIQTETNGRRPPPAKPAGLPCPGKAKQNLRPAGQIRLVKPQEGRLKEALTRFLPAVWTACKEQRKTRKAVEIPRTRACPGRRRRQSLPRRRQGSGADRLFPAKTPPPSSGDPSPRPVHPRAHGSPAPAITWTCSSFGKSTMGRMGSLRKN